MRCIGSLYHRVRVLRRMKSIVFSNSEIRLPVISQLSRASIVPPAFVLPFQRVQNTRLCLLFYFDSIFG